MSIFTKASENWRKVSAGKVRDIYEPINNDDLAEPLIALVASDRVSAFDQQLDVTIPGKGKFLTAISANWFKFADKRGISSAFRTASDDELPKFFKRPEFQGRTTIMRKLRMIPVEVIVRGYITGSAWKAYEKGAREICGITLPDNLVNSEQFKEPLFTPTTKAPVGEHDENITFSEMEEIIKNADVQIYDKSAQDHLAIILKNIALSLYRQASERALARDVILADTKFEFGVDRYGILCVGDELLTPDSSRFWDATKYKLGQEQASMDKQIIRNYLAAEKEAGRPVTSLPQEIIDQTVEAYESCYRRLLH